MQLAARRASPAAAVRHPAAAAAKMQLAARRASPAAAVRHRACAAASPAQPRRGGMRARCRAGQAAPRARALTLYGSQGSRSPLVSWYLHELGLDFEVAAPNAEGNPHPMGQVPALRDVDGVELFESGAILAYLADAYGGADTPVARASVGKWLVWANATLDPCCFKETPDGKVYDSGVRDKSVPRALAALEMHLREGCVSEDDLGFVLPGGFSAADCNIAAYLLYVLQFFPDASFARTPAVAAYARRCADRPAYRRAFGDEVAEYCIAKLDKDVGGDKGLL